MKIEYEIIGLHCTNCAQSMQMRIEKLEGVNSCEIDFFNRSMTVDIKEESNELTQAKIVTIIKNKGLTYKKKANNYTSTKSSESHKKQYFFRILQIVLGSLLLIISVIFEHNFIINLIFSILSFIVLGYNIIYKAFRNLISGQLFDENFLMVVASIGAFCLQEYSEAVSIVLLYQIGDFCQSIAINNSRKSISSLLEIRPDYANLIEEDEVRKVNASEVVIGDLILVKPGERVPLDGKVIEGNTIIDTSMLTGETETVKIKTGENILSGVVNLTGVITIQVEKTFSDSTANKIVELVESATKNKAKTENFITKFARLYTPIVVGCALVLGLVPPIFLGNWGEWINRALVFLVISCPCALVISIPLAYFGAIGRASKRGILIKGGNYLEALNKIDTIAFDKTGTLTKGVFKITEIENKNGYSEKEVLDIAAHLEYYSTHPISRSILKAYNGKIEVSRIKNYQEIHGLGISGDIDGKKVIAGSSELLTRQHINFEIADTYKTTIYLAIEDEYLGRISISDEIREDSLETIESLKKMCNHLIMLTGDKKEVAEEVANQFDISPVYSQLMPNQKLEIIENIIKEKKNKSSVVFIGDGTNDCPVIARSDVGIAMGNIGTDAAISAADIVIVDDSPKKILTTIKIAKTTRRIVWENIIFALLCKVIVLVLGAIGITSIWAAVFADVGVSLIAIVNSLRINLYKFKK